MALSRGLGLRAASFGIAAWALAAQADAVAGVEDDVQVVFRDGEGKDIDVTREHASLERTPPERAPATADAHYDDPDALRVVAASASATAPALSVESIAAAGTKLDRLPELALEPVPCG